MRFWSRPKLPHLQRIFADIKFVLEPLEKPPKPKKIQGNATNPEDQAEKGSAKSKYDPSKDKKKNPRQKRENPKEAIKLAMEAIALFLALVVGCIYVWQAREAQRQAIAAEKQLIAMQMATELEERAWLFNGEISYVPADDGTNSIFKVTVTNVGKTPALNIENVIKAVYQKEKIPDRDDPPITITNGLTINPGCPFWIPSAKTSPEQMGGVEVGITMYVYGTIWYTDVFRKLHWMQFCYEVTTDASKQHILMRPTNFHDSCDDAETDQEN